MNKVVQHLGIFIFFFILVFIINKIPDWYIISWGDFYQLLNINQNIDRNLFAWFNNSGQWQFNPLITTYPFYFIQYFLYNLWLTYSQISSFLMFQFLVWSFYAFYFAQKLLFKDLKYKFIWPFSYSLNFTVLTVLFYPWIITHHFLVYMIIPLVIAFFVNYLNSKFIFKKEYFFFLLVFICSLPAYNNVAFLFSLWFIQLLFFIFFLAFSKNDILSLIKKWFLLIFAQIFLSLLVILPFLSSQYAYKDNALNTKAFAWDAITNIMMSTSSNPFNSITLAMDNWRFPNINLETKFQQVPDIYIILASIFGFIFIVIILYWFLIRQENNKIFYVFLILYLILLFLSFRLTSPFDSINLLFYKTLTLGLFRSPDKIFVFIPFFTIILFIYSLQRINLNKKWIMFIYVSLFLSVSFIFTWWIIKQYLYNTNWYNQGLVKIPQEYYDIQKIINKDEKNNTILSIPYSVVNSLNWSNYPKWWYIGHDLLHLLYNKNYISANSYDHGALETKLSLQGFSTWSIETKELIKVIQKFWWRYILNHKDVDKNFLWLTDWNLLKLLQEKVILKVNGNSYFDLYEVNKNYINALINWLNLKFQKINPIKYTLNLTLWWEKEIVSFLQSHNSQWKLYLKPNENASWCKTLETYNNDWKKVTECEHKQEFFQWEELSYLYRTPLFENSHQVIYDYANSWTISKQEIIDYVNQNYSDELKKEGFPKKLANWKTDYKYYTLNKDWSIDVELTLYFKPQSYFYLGLIISGTTFLLLIWYLGFDAVSNRRRNEEKKNQTE